MDWGPLKSAEKPCAWGSRMRHVHGSHGGRVGPWANGARRHGGGHGRGVWVRAERAEQAEGAHLDPFKVSVQPRDGGMGPGGGLGGATRVERGVGGASGSKRRGWAWVEGMESGTMGEWGQQPWWGPWAEGRRAERAEQAEGVGLD